MNVLRWLLLAASVVFYRVWFPEPPPPGPTHLDYHLIVIALVALYRGTYVGTIVGWGFGFLVGAPDPAMLGWSSLMGATMGWVVGYCGERLFLEFVFSRWLVMWIVILVHRLIYLGIITEDWGRWKASFLTGGLASAGLSATLGVLVSLLWDRARDRRRSAGKQSSSTDED